jgi:hypothetical protein
MEQLKGIRFSLGIEKRINTDNKFLSKVTLRRKELEKTTGYRKHWEEKDLSLNHT